MKEIFPSLFLIRSDRPGPKTPFTYLALLWKVDCALSEVVTLKVFDDTDERRIFEKGRFEIVRLGGVSIGRGTYEPGWRWSLHVGPTVGAVRCQIEHVGLVLSGVATAVFEYDSVIELRAGVLFHIPAKPHDSWVVGDEPYVSLHLLAAGNYAT